MSLWRCHLAYSKACHQARWWSTDNSVSDSPEFKGKTNVKTFWLLTGSKVISHNWTVLIRKYWFHKMFFPKSNAIGNRERIFTLGVSVLRSSFVTSWFIWLVEGVLFKNSHYHEQSCFECVCSNLKKLFLYASCSLNLTILQHIALAELRLLELTI